MDKILKKKKKDKVKEQRKEDYVGNGKETLTALYRCKELFQIQILFRAGGCC